MVHEAMEPFFAHSPMEKVCNKKQVTLLEFCSMRAKCLSLRKKCMTRICLLSDDL